MTHAYIPDFSVTPTLRTLTARLLPTDPIYAAIERHRDAVGDYRFAPSLITNDECDAALDKLVVTACSTRGGAIALLAHLQAFLTEEEDFAEGWWPSFPMAQARAADLALLLGADALPVPIPVSFPSGRMPPRAPAPLPVGMRIVRVVGAATELLAACVIVGGGCVVTGLVSLL